jgi:hypothetical protein
MRVILLTLALGAATVFARPSASQASPSQASTSQTARPASPATAHKSTSAASSAQPHLTDRQIEANIRAKLAKSKIAADKFQFHVQGGVVTIEGKTDVVQRKGAATRMARTAGAIAVVNHIQISEAAKQKAAANLEKARKRAQVIHPGTASSGSTAGKAPASTANPGPSKPAPSKPASAKSPPAKKNDGTSGQNR